MSEIDQIAAEMGRVKLDSSRIDEIARAHLANLAAFPMGIPPPNKYYEENKRRLLDRAQVIRAEAAASVALPNTPAPADSDMMVVPAAAPSMPGRVPAVKRPAPDTDFDSTTREGPFHDALERVKVGLGKEVAISGKMIEPGEVLGEPYVQGVTFQGYFDRPGYYDQQVETDFESMSKFMRQAVLTSFGFVAPGYSNPRTLSERCIGVVRYRSPRNESGFCFGPQGLIELVGSPEGSSGCTPGVYIVKQAVMPSLLPPIEQSAFTCGFGIDSHSKAALYVAVMMMRAKAGFIPNEKYVLSSLFNDQVAAYLLSESGSESQYASSIYRPMGASDGSVGRHLFQASEAASQPMTMVVEGLRGSTPVGLFRMSKGGELSQNLNTLASRCMDGPYTVRMAAVVAAVLTTFTAKVSGANSWMPLQMRVVIMQALRNGPPNLVTEVAFTALVHTVCTTYNSSDDGFRTAAKAESAGKLSAEQAAQRTKGHFICKSFMLGTSLLYLMKVGIGSTPLDQRQIAEMLISTIDERSGLQMRRRLLKYLHRHSVISAANYASLLTKVESEGAEVRYSSGR